nr:hypothetical protein [Tanacetum cinerariifolium]
AGLELSFLEEVSGNGLSTKRKLGFVRGNVIRMIDPVQAELWDTCNNVVISWIMNFVSDSIAKSRKSTFEQKGSSVSEDYIRMKCIWEELDYMTQLTILTNVTPESNRNVAASAEGDEDLDHSFAACKLCLLVVASLLINYWIFDTRATDRIIKLKNELVLKNTLVVHSFKFSLHIAANLIFHARRKHIELFKIASSLSSCGLGLGLGLGCRLVPSCCVIFDLDPLSLSFDFVSNYKIFKSFSLRSLSSCDLVSMIPGYDLHQFDVHNDGYFAHLPLNYVDGVILEMGVKARTSTKEGVEARTSIIDKKVKVNKDATKVVETRRCIVKNDSETKYESDDDSVYQSDKSVDYLSPSEEEVIKLRNRMKVNREAKAKEKDNQNPGMNEPNAKNSMPTDNV